MKKKSKDKRKQQKYIEGDKECEDCGTSSSVDDPLRTLAIAEGRASEGMIPLIWGRARKVTGTSFILPGKKCYYCNRSRRSKAMYRKMPKKEFKAFVSVEETKKIWKKDRGVTIIILNDKGFDGRIYENDYNNPTYVDLIEEVGEKSYRLGTEMREDIFLLRYTAEQRKALNTKKESKFNLRTNTMETFV